MTSTDPSPITTAAAADDGGERPRQLLPWAITAVALLVAAWSTFQWLSLQDLERDAEARAEVTAVAAGFTETLVNWDADDGLDETLEQLRSFGAGDFLAEADELFGGGALRQQLEAVGARSQGEIEDLFVQRIEGDRAIVFVVAQQVIGTDATEGTDTTFRSARIRLERIDGDWRVTDVELVTPELTEVQDGQDDGAVDETAPEEDDQ